MNMQSGLCTPALRMLALRTLALLVFVAAASAMLLRPGLVGPDAATGAAGVEPAALHAMLVAHN